ncbi:BlaI/MecI/CopY family transcriptional regulator [bacterium]|nr:BlaI/MecI/CopY family transcriptional regulator [bacterium]
MKRRQGTPFGLSRRERQILDSIYQRGQATAAEVMVALPDAPTYTTVRGLLRVLERKGHIRHIKEGRRFLYYPVRPRAETGRTMLKHVLGTFFNGSAVHALSSLLGDTRKLEKNELEILKELIDKARKRRRV